MMVQLKRHTLMTFWRKTTRLFGHRSLV